MNIDQRLLTVWQTVGLSYQYSFLLPHLIITLGAGTFIEEIHDKVHQFLVEPRPGCCLVLEETLEYSG